MYERKYSGVNDRKAYPVDRVAFKDGDDVSYLNVEDGKLKLNGETVGDGSGGVTSWNDLTDKPFGEDKIPLIRETTLQTVFNENIGKYTAGVDVESDVQLYIGLPVSIVLNGETYQTSVNEYGLIGNISILEPSFPDTGEAFLIFPSEGMMATKEAMEIKISATVSVLKQLDTEFLKNDVVKYGTLGEITTIEWDGNTDGLETIVYNAINYYKVSDVVIPVEHIVKLKSQNRDGDMIDEFIVGVNCYAGRGCIVVTEVGSCEVESITFTANSTGVYFSKANHSDGVKWCGVAEFDTRRENGRIHLTNPSGVKFQITVDDNGKLTATEVTE